MKTKLTNLEVLKTYESACDFLGTNPVLPGVEGLQEKQGKALIAVHKLSVLYEAAWKVKGEVLDWDNSNQWKRELVFKMSSSGAGFSFGANTARWYSGSTVGARLALPDDKEIEDFMITHHFELYRDWMCK